MKCLIVPHPSAGGFDDRGVGEGGMRCASLIAAGGLAMAVGVLVYLTDRSPLSAALIPSVGALAGRGLFGVIGQWLPSFVHPFAFSLFTAAALPRRAWPAYGVCAAWWAVNVVFEGAQHPQISAGLAESLPAVFGDTWLVRSLSNYVLRGQFDVGDIVAATAGALAAAVVLGLMHRRGPGS